MTEIRTIHADLPGPINLDVHIATGEVRVIGEQRDTAEVTLRAPSNTADAATVRDATYRANADTLSIWVSTLQPRRPDADGGVSNIINGTVHGSAIQAGNLHGQLSLNGNDQIHIQGHTTGTENTTAIEVEARLPEGSHVQIHGNPTIHTRGTLASVQVS